MLTALAYCPKDQDQAIRLADWIAELGSCKGHDMLLVQDTELTGDSVAATLSKSFGSVTVLPFVDHFHSWPAAPNACFSQTARHIESTMAQPFLWLEPDVVPLKTGWLDALAAEYATSGKPFLGDFVSVHTPELDVEDHCSGVAIYPGRMSQHAGNALIAGDGAAWDVVAARQILPHMHKSKLLMHSWKHQPFKDWEQVEREIFAFKPGCVLFHADKSGSLIQLLREHNLPVPVLAEPVCASERDSGEARESTRMLSVDESQADRTKPARNVKNELDSRGGQFISQQVGETARTPGGDFPASSAAKHFRFHEGNLVPV